MAVGLSDGTGYEDNNEYLLSATQPRIDVYRDKAPDTSSTMPLGGSTEPAGALKSSGGTGTPENTPNTNTGWMEPDSDVHPAPDYLNPPDRDTPFPRPRMTDILSGLYGAAKNALDLPNAPEWGVDPQSGEVHTSTQAIEKAADLAGFMTFGPAPVAGKLADGTLGSFMGVKSATIDKAALYKAQNLEMDGVHSSDIWNETGTFRGADGRWRQEISDQDVNILAQGTNLHPAEPAGKGMAGWGRIEAPESISIKDNKLPDNASLQDLMKWFQSPLTDVRLSHVLDHPELYKAYPWLKDTKVFPMPEGVNYNGMTRGKDLFMNKLPTEEFTSTLMHEVQHLIQDHEGFAHGANPDMFLPKNLKEAEQQFVKVRQEAETDIGKRMGDPGAVVAWKNAINLKNAGYLTGDRLDFLKALEEKHPDVYRQLSNIVKSENLLFEAKGTAADRYRKVMGEVESRNVQARLDFSHLDRAINSPMKTEEMITPRSQQINSTDIANHTVGRESASASLPKGWQERKNVDGLGTDVIETPTHKMTKKVSGDWTLTTKTPGDWNKKGYGTYEFVSPEKGQRILDAWAQKDWHDRLGSASIPGEFTPYSKRWPNNDNARPLNEQEQYIQMYDAWHAFGEKMNPKSELDTHTYNKMGKALADWQSKTYGYDVPYVPIEHDPLNVNKLRKE